MSCSPSEGKPPAKGSPSTGWELTDGHSLTEAEDSNQTWVLVTTSTDDPRHRKGVNQVQGIQPGTTEMGPKQDWRQIHEGSIQETHHPPPSIQEDNSENKPTYNKAQARTEGPGQSLNRASGPMGVAGGPRWSWSRLLRPLTPVKAHRALKPKCNEVLAFQVRV